MRLHWWPRVQASGTGLTLVSTIAPSLEIQIPYLVRVALLGLGLLMIVWPLLEYAVDQIWRTRRMWILADALILISALGLISGLVWRFSFEPFTQSKPAAVVATVATPVVAATVPDVTMRFIRPSAPALVLVNDSPVVAKQIKWVVLLYNLDDLKNYSNPAFDSVEPLPIPIAIFDFLRPGTKSGPLSLFGLPTVRPHVKAGDRLIGTAGVSCPDCKQDRAFVVSIKYGESGWFGELPHGDTLVPTKSLKPFMQQFYEVLSATIPEKDRITITDP